MGGGFCLALDQSGTAGSEEDDLRRLAERAAEAAGLGAELLLLPELDWGGYGDAATSRARSLSQEELQARLAQIATRQGIDIVCGYPERFGATLYNSLLWIGAGGQLVANYRKLHLWGDYEEAVFTAGDTRPPLVTRHGLSFGLLICFDLDHPVTAQDLARRGADVILVASATSAPYHMVPCAQAPARAYENAVFLAFCNRSDSCGEDRFIGESRILAPDASALAANKSREAQMISARIVLEDFSEWRRLHSYHGALRLDVYPAP
jgi:predicted amidohydrolase